MELRVVGLLLLLSGAVTCEEAVGSSQSVGRAKGDECNATANQTLAYFVHSDLLEFHKVDGIIAFGFTRKGFYYKNTKGLNKLIYGENVACSYEARLVCHVDKCVSCSDLQSETGEVDAKLVEACALEGTSGKDAELIPLREGQVADDGWLTAEDMREWRKKLGGSSLWRKSWAPCPFNFDLQKGWYLLNHVVKKYVGAGELEAELEDYWDFYEERLWMFRGGKHTDLYFSYSGNNRRGDGPCLCGMDAVCVDCKAVMNKTYSVNPPPELVAGCEVQGRPDGRAKKDKCVKTTTTPESTSEDSSGVRIKGKKVFVIAAAIMQLLFK